MNLQQSKLRTWVEIDSQTVKHNYKIFRSLIGKKIQLMAIVKSNAYGHGLVEFSKLVDNLGIDWFGVDSIVEAERLCLEGIKKPILVLGPTLISKFPEAKNKDIYLTVSNFETLKSLIKGKNCPKFHIKIDTGMHRQGFYLEDTPKVIKKLKAEGSKPQAALAGLYTHFASAKDINYPTYTLQQVGIFNKVINLFKKAGFKNLVKHAAATGGAIISSKYHFDMVRIGIGLYGLWPSLELKIQLDNQIKLKPVLSWKTILMETKPVKAGSFIGYDLTEQMPNDGRLGILPIGYWHGFDRGLSSIGEVLILGKRTKIIGRVSMDMAAVNLTGVPQARIGNEVTLIGKQDQEEIAAGEIAKKIGTISYEVLTRINPLIKRIVV